MAQVTVHRSRRTTNGPRRRWRTLISAPHPIRQQAAMSGEDHDVIGKRSRTPHALSVWVRVLRPSSIPGDCGGATALPVGLPVRVFANRSAEGRFRGRFCGKTARAGRAVTPGARPCCPVSDRGSLGFSRSAAGGVGLCPNPLLRFSGADGGNPIADRDLKALRGSVCVIESRDLLARQARANGTLDRAKGVLFVR